MKLDEDSKAIVDHEKEKWKAINHYVYEQGVTGSDVTHITNCIYLARRQNIRLVDEDR